MEFGRIPVAELEHIDFTLPEDAAMNAQVLKPGAPPKVYLGCTQWGRKEWVGKIYPKGMKDTAALDHYVRHFNAVELNATHYQVYGPDVISKWAAKAKGKDFRFCPKIPQVISHYSGFRNVDATTTSFLEGVLAFEENLGPIFMQLSEKYSPGMQDHLFHYLETLPVDLQFFIEVRHPQWFEDPRIKADLFNRLRALNIGAVITDTAGRRDAAHMTLPVPKAFIRYVGNSLHATDHTRMQAWTARIMQWLDQGLQELYFFIHTPDEAYAPEMALEMVNQLNAACGLSLVKPQFIQTSLF